MRKNLINSFFAVMTVCIYGSIKAQENLYPIYQKLNGEHVAFVNSLGKMKFALDSSLHLDVQGFEVFKSKFIFAYKVVDNKKVYYAINKTGKVVHEFASGEIPVRMIVWN